jgi:hypothetical protein
VLHFLALETLVALWPRVVKLIHVKGTTLNSKVYDGNPEKVDDGHVHLARFKKERGTGIKNKRAFVSVWTC